MKKLLITLILVSCITLTSCGPGTSEGHRFESFDEFIEILNGRFMFPTYYPHGFNINANSDNNIDFIGMFGKFGEDNQTIIYENFYSFYYNISIDTNKKVYRDFYIEDINITFINYESSVYKEKLFNTLINLTALKYYDNKKVYVIEYLYPLQPYDEEITQRVLYNSYMIFDDIKPYQIRFKIIVKSIDEAEINELTPEINEMTYTEAMKMFDSLQPLN